MIRSQLANAVTVSRILLALAVIVLISHPVLTLWLFLAAISSDFLDGAIARRLGACSSFGAILDPKADQILIAIGLISLLLVGPIPMWALFIIAGVTIIATIIGRSVRQGSKRQFMLIPTGVVVLSIYELIIMSFIVRAYGFYWYDLAILGVASTVLIYGYRTRIHCWVHYQPTSS